MQWKSFKEKAANWELWPFWLRYGAIMPVWLWYCLKSGSFWFFSASNPTITFGGFDGEGKEEMYEQLPKNLYPKTVYTEPAETEQALLDIVAAARFAYPFCVKPDVGLKGLLFRKIDTEAELLYYHRHMEMRYLVQELSRYPLEVSVFYYRHPAQQQGVISGFIQKDLMEVVGDGKATLSQLIAAHPIAKYRVEELRNKHAAFWETVLPQGERYVLAHAANLSRGARFSQLMQHADDRLLAFFDDLSHRTFFYYGRYDIKCRSVEDLKRGEHFHILEFNGAGAEPNHVYHAGLTLVQAQKEILKHWKALYQISRYNHQHGYHYWPFFKGWHFLRQASKHAGRLQELETRILP